MSGVLVAGARLALSPWVWLATFLAMALALLALPVRLPVGPNFWDIAVYLDGAHRLTLGHMPHRISSRLSAASATRCITWSSSSSRTRIRCWWCNGVCCWWRCRRL